MCVGEWEAEASGGSLCFSFSESLLFRPPILEPDLDLGLGEFKVLSKLCSLSDREVFLLSKFSLECNQLRAGERSSGFPVLLLFLESS